MKTIVLTELRKDPALKSFADEFEKKGSDAEVKDEKLRKKIASVVERLGDLLGDDQVSQEFLEGLSLMSMEPIDEDIMDDEDEDFDDMDEDGMAEEE